MVRHRRAVVAIWVVALIALGAGAAAQHSVLRDVFSVPGTNSQSATDVLDQRFPAQQQPQATIVIAARAGRDGHRRRDPGGGRIDAHDDRQAARRRVGHEPVHAAGAGVEERPHRDRHRVATTGTYSDLPVDAFKDLTAAAKPLEATGVQVEFGGQVTDIQNAGEQRLRRPDRDRRRPRHPASSSSGPLLAAVLPIGVAIFGVVIAGVDAPAHRDAGDDRHGRADPRLDDRPRRRDRLLAARRSAATCRTATRGWSTRPASRTRSAPRARRRCSPGAASRSRCAGSRSPGIPYVATLGYSAGLFVAVMVLAALTLLPAVLGFVGPADHAQAQERRGRRRGRRHVVPVRARGVAPRGAVRRRVARSSSRSSPRRSSTCSSASPTTATRPTSQTQRKAYDLITEGFGEGANGPLLVAISLPTADAGERATELVADVEKLAARARQGARASRR